MLQQHFLAPASCHDLPTHNITHAHAHAHALAHYLSTHTLPDLPQCQDPRVSEEEDAAPRDGPLARAGAGHRVLCRGQLAFPCLTLNHAIFFVSHFFWFCAYTQLSVHAWCTASTHPTGTLSACARTLTHTLIHAHKVYTVEYSWALQGLTTTRNHTLN